MHNIQQCANKYFSDHLVTKIKAIAFPSHNFIQLILKLDDDNISIHQCKLDAAFLHTKKQIHKKISCGLEKHQMNHEATEKRKEE